MRAEVVERQVTTNGGMTSGMFGISQKDAAHIFGILRSNLYTDKVMAVLREYSTNAWDEHVDAGIPDRPIKVVLPTSLEPSLVIRDYGRGLSEEGIFEVFIMYGASTKRDTDDTNGSKGIGSKSAFAYSDTFTITSYHKGMKRIYIAVIDETNKGKVTRFLEEPCGDETGIEVKIPAKTRDIYLFHTAARTLFPYFYPMPVINLPIEAKEIDRTRPGKLYRDGNTQWVASMGVVPYRLDFSKMRAELEAVGLLDLTQKSGGELYFHINDVSVGASREEVEYTDKTKNAIVSRLKVLYDELTVEVQATLDDMFASSWLKRMRVQEFTESTHIKVPKYAAWYKEKIDLYEMTEVVDEHGNVIYDENDEPKMVGPRTFRLLAYRKKEYGRRTQRLMQEPTVRVKPDTRFFYRDTKKSLVGYSLGENDYVVDPTKDLPQSEVMTDLLQRMGAVGLDGVPILNISTLNHSSDFKGTGGVSGGGGPSYKAWYSKRYFTLNGSELTFPYAGSWTVTDHVPQNDDVYVILERFQPTHTGDFNADMHRDRAIIKLLGGTWPTIYGIKNTASAPVDPAVVPGLPYKKWVEAEKAKLLSSPDIQAKMQAMYTHDELSSHGLTGWYTGAIEAGRGALGEDHPVMVLVRKAQEAAETLKTLTNAERDVLITFSQINKSEVDTLITSVYANYPLIAPIHNGPGFVILGRTGYGRRDLWVQYIKIADYARNNPPIDTTDTTNQEDAA
jgi:hypothetical protein